MQQSPDDFAARVRGWMRGEQSDPAMDQYAVLMRQAGQAAQAVEQPTHTVGFSFFKGELPSVEEARKVGNSPDGWKKNEAIFRKDYLAKFNLEDDIEWTIGLWDGPEPSFVAQVKGKTEDVLNMSKQWRADYNQDAVANLIPAAQGKGGVLFWDLPRRVTDKELDTLLEEMRSANEDIKAGKHSDLGIANDFMIGLTAKKNRRIEFWFADEVERDAADWLLQLALEKLKITRRSKWFDRYIKEMIWRPS